MAQQSYTPSERQNGPTKASKFRWWWAILAPYVFVLIAVGGLVILGNTDTTGPIRLLLALALLVGAGLVHVGLYRDARHVRATDSEWTPQYWWYPVGGAVVLLGALLIIDVTVPGGIFGAMILSMVFGVFITAPLYLSRRSLTSREQ